MGYDDDRCRYLGNTPCFASRHEHLGRYDQRHPVGLREESNLHDIRQPERLFDHARVVLQRGHGQPAHGSREPDHRPDWLPSAVQQRYDGVDRFTCTPWQPLHRRKHRRNHRLGQRNAGRHRLHRDRNTQRQRHRDLLVQPAEPCGLRRRRSAQRVAGRLRCGRRSNTGSCGRQRRRRRRSGRQR